MRYRCYGCVSEGGLRGRDFDADRPECDRCGITAASRKDLRDLVVELAVIHFDPPSRVDGVGEGKAACDDRIVTHSANRKFTGYAASVTCARCRAADAWKRAAADQGGREFVPEGDVPLKVDAQKRSFTPDK